MEIDQIFKKLNSITLTKISLIISLLTEFSILFLTSIFEGKIKYIGYVFFIMHIILTFFCDKDLFLVSFKNQKKLILLKNSYILLFIFILFYFPVLFYNSYINFKNSYTYFMFIISIIITLIFHFLLIMIISNFIKSEGDEKNQSNDELIEEEIKRAMIDE